jgi:hypothetical protein
LIWAVLVDAAPQTPARRAEHNVRFGVLHKIRDNSMFIL